MIVWVLCFSSFKMGSIYSILRARASGTLSYIYLIYTTL